MKITKYWRNFYYNRLSISRYDYSPDPNGVVVSLTTVPSRINEIKPTLISLLRQRPGVIEINVAKQPLKQDVPWQIPDWLTSLQAVKLIWLDYDYGPASKLIPTLQRYAGSNKQILVVDDDMLYPRDLLTNLLRARQRLAPQGNAVICASGHLLDRDHKFFATQVRPKPYKNQYARVAIAEGCGGYLVEPSYFDLATLTDTTDAPQGGMRQDDIWFSGHLSRLNIPKYITTVGRRKTLQHALTPAITGDRVVVSDQLVEYFRDAWHAEEYGGSIV